MSLMFLSAFLDEDWKEDAMTIKEKIAETVMEMMSNELCL